MKRWNSLTGIIQALVRAKTVEIEVVDRIKIIPRVQRIVTQVIERVAVELIGAPLADDGGLAAHRESVFGAGRVGDDFVFLDAIYPHRRADDRRIVDSKKADHICAVEHVRIRMDRHAVVADEIGRGTRLNSSHTVISYAVFCLKKKKKTTSK